MFFTLVYASFSVQIISREFPILLLFFPSKICKHICHNRIFCFGFQELNLSVSCLIQMCVPFFILFVIYTMKHKYFAAGGNVMQLFCCCCFYCVFNGGANIIFEFALNESTSSAEQAQTDVCHAKLKELFYHSWTFAASSCGQNPCSGTVLTTFKHTVFSEK